jgi:hypothetical protein
MPIKRARNNVRRWYAETMTRMLPPLPNGEWDNIHAMAVGERRIGLVRRRGRGLDASPEPVAADELSAVEEAIALNKPSRADKPAGMQRPHSITPKFMRRLYTRILMLCCKVEYDHGHKRWKAIWGEPRKSIKPGVYRAPTDESLFAGVDATGQVPKALKKHAVDKSTHIQPRNEEGDYVRFPFFTEYLPEGHPLLRELNEWKRKREAAAARAQKRKVS